MPAGGNSRFRGYPARMSERQQLALLLQITSQEIVSPGSNSESEKLRIEDRLIINYAEQIEGRETENCNEFTDQEKQDEQEQDVLKQKELRSEEDTRPRAGGESGAPCEMRRTPPQNKVDRSGTGQSGSSPRVTLRINNVRSGARDEKKGSSTRPSFINASTSPMDTTSSPSTTTTAPSNSSSNTNSTNSNPINSSSSSNSNPNSSSNSNTNSSSNSNPNPNPNSNTNTSNKLTSSSAASASSTATTTTSSAASITSASSSSATPANVSPDTTDVYEFKSSKEPTPVRGSSSSPNPPGDKDKINTNNNNNNNNNNSSSSSSSGSSTATSTTTTTTNTTANNNSSTNNNNSSNSAIPSSNISGSATGAPATDSSASTGAAELITTGSPSSKRSYEDTDDQDEEIKRKKRKEVDPKEGNKSTPGRQSTGRAAGDKFDKVSTSVTASFVEQCVKTGKQTSSATSSASASASANKNQSSGSASSAAATAGDRKSPSSTAASSPKPAGNSASSKAGDSDGDEDRGKGSEGAAPKVPPLKIVIPQSTAEQEQGARNGKNTSTRGHQLPYVVPSSNSSDSNDKDSAPAGGPAGGTTSPTEAVKTEDKKDFAGAIHNEERSTHHQRVLRSSHRSGNGNGTSKDSAQYSNSSPLATDRSNNSSPQARHTSPTPETNTETKPVITEVASSNPKSSSTSREADKPDKSDIKVKDEPTESTSASSATTPAAPTPTATELHPRKRKMKPKEAAAAASTAESSEANSTGTEVHPHDQPITNCYQLFLSIRKQIERRRKGLFPVQPKPPQGFKDYLMNRCTYVLAGNANNEPNVKPPIALSEPMKTLFLKQESERYRLRMQHVVEKEKLVLSVEQEILRVHGRAARALANQELPFSACTILKDEEVYNVITPEQEEKDRNLRSRYNGRLFLSWLQDVDDKWEKIKESMLLRHHNEAESLHAVQKMDWEWKLKEVGLCEVKVQPQIDDSHVPMVHVSDDFDLLPA
ncbi:dentin sialophosphoprotein isoform X3 [Microplitis mediator]|uniref:dentin sialophosphoprotein isoform X3 n=1 Tax=Microplitis mediator TaxID=375433 RepID=UPI0025560B1D|nr:dentin sialophosphoprotein isoform X3 [Microplitis mediator]